MTSRLPRLGKYAAGIAAPAASYLYVNPEAREPVATAFKDATGTIKNTAVTAAPLIKSAFYNPPTQPITEEDKIKYLTAFGSAIQKAKAKGYNGNQYIGSSEIDNILKEIFDRASYYATQKGMKTIPTTIAGAEELYIDAKRTWANTGRDAASAIGSAASAVWSLRPWASKPLAGGKRKARRSKRSSHRRSRSRRNRSRRN